MSDEPAEGVEVIGVTPGSAADDAGLRAGDVITSVNGEAMSADSEHLASMKLLDFMKGVEVGDSLNVEYLRDGKVGNVEVEPRVMRENALAWTGRVPRLQTLPALPGGIDQMRFALRGWRGAWSDMELVALSKDVGRYFGTDEGLLVVSAPTSAAVDLKDGDVITSIDGRAPTSVNHCMRILGSYQPGEAMTLEILRDKRRQTVEIEVPEHKKPH